MRGLVRSSLFLMLTVLVTLVVIVVSESHPQLDSMKIHNLMNIGVKNHLEGTFKVHFLNGDHDGVMNDHQQFKTVDSDWIGMYRIENGDSFKFFAQSLHSPLAVTFDGKRMDLVVYVPKSHNDCIRLNYDMIDTTQETSSTKSGIHMTLSIFMENMLRPALLSKWRMELNEDGYLSEIAQCTEKDSLIFINDLKEESNDALIACFSKKTNRIYRIRSRMAEIELDTIPMSTVSSHYSDLTKSNCTTVSPKQQFKSFSPSQSLLNSERRKTSVTSTPWYKMMKIHTSTPHMNGVIMIKNPHAAPNATKVCVFLHGAGYRFDQEPAHSFSYWGNINAYTTQCKESWFIRRNTANRGWTSEELQTSYCALALVNSKPNTTLITDTIIFTHSMGNLIFPTAMYKGYCELDLKTSTWVSLSAPFNGSKAAYYLKTLCYDYDHQSAPNSIQKIFDFIAEVTQNCDGENPIEADATLYPDFCDIDRPSYRGKKPMCLGSPIFSYSKPLISARMCGFSPMGLVTYYGIALELFANLVQYGEANDGLVPASSCLMDTPMDKFSPTPESALYSANINHAGR